MDDDSFREFFRSYILLNLGCRQGRGGGEEGVVYMSEKIFPGFKLVMDVTYIRTHSCGPVHASRRFAGFFLLYGYFLDRSFIFSLTSLLVFLLFLF